MLRRVLVLLICAASLPCLGETPATDQVQTPKPAAGEQPAQQENVAALPPKQDQPADTLANDDAKAPPDINTVAQLAIQAAQSTTETVKWVFGIAGGLLAVFVGFLGWLGWKSIREVVQSIKNRADAKVKEALTAFDGKAAENLKKMEEQLQALLASCNVVCVQSLEALRHVLIGERWVDTEPGKAQSFREAIQASLAVQEHAKKIPGLERSHAWAVGLEAYAANQLKNYDQAIKAQIKAIELAGDDRLSKEWHFRFNLACYYTKAGRLDEAAEPLRNSILVGGEEARVQAWKEPDLLALRQSATHMALLADVLGVQPPQEHAAENAPAANAAGS